MNRARLFNSSIRAMGRYRLRTGFMMLGSLVGVAALTFTVSLGNSAKRKMIRTLQQVVGESAVLVIGGGSRMMGSPRAGAARLTIDDVAAAAHEVPGIEDWDPQADLGGQIARYEDRAATVRVLGGSERFARVWGRGVMRGDEFDAAAVAGSARVALVGVTVAQSLFGDADPTGAEIRIGAVPFRVIGVLEPFGTDMHGMDRDNEIVVPVTTLMRRLTNVDAINAARFSLAAGADPDSVAEGVRTALRGRHAIARGQPDDFRLVTSVEAQRTLAFMTRILLLYVPLVAAVIVLVGGIVASAVMLASVNQRIGEIGLRRAVGARPEDIRWQFVGETAVVVVAGGIGGIVLGYAGVVLVAARMQLGGGVSWVAVAVGLVAAALTGLLAGVLPARRAARLDPAAALR